ncbi:hypothetical protein [Treponema pedis]|uniref:hypothetical protein n=1 Tax=Treponema pedis TaxID=409322 RepID=UPI003133E6BF
MNKKAQYIILCEDKQTQCFLRYFLIRHSINRGRIRFLKLPMQGCGEQYVRENYPVELQKIRSKNFNNIILFVCIDADMHSVTDRYKELDDECVEQQIPSRTSIEPVVFFVPKRSIETWIEWLEGKEGIDEITSYSHLKEESECKPQAEKLAEMFIQNADLSMALPSIQAAQIEYNTRTN